MSSVRVRFAPSPTGYLHVGGARTALYNYLFAKHAGGKFIYRVEDTDVDRSTEESMRMQIEDMKWLGLNWDEGPHPETLADMGSYGPYRQSKRQDIYQKYARQLVESGKAFYCFMSEEEIEVQKKQAEKEGRPPHIQSPYRTWTLSQAEEKMKKGDKAAIRFKVPDKKDIPLKDLVRGDIHFPSDMVGDFVIIRSSGMPVYNFCCVIDDNLMKISHVLRAEEHLSNTPRQLMIYEALGWQPPQFGHLSIILGGDRQKLSKRHGATSVNEYKVRGYLHEAMNNFIALLGWSSPTGAEILSMEEMIKQFGTERLHAAAPVFDDKKLLWMNSQYLRALPDESLWKLVEPFLKTAGLKLQEDQEWRFKALRLFKTSMETLADAPALFKFVALDPVDIQGDALEVLGWPTTPDVIKKWMSLIQNHSNKYLTAQEFEVYQEKIKEDIKVKGKQLFMPVRVAVIGRPHGAELKELVPLLDRETLVKRAQTAIQRLG